MGDISYERKSQAVEPGKIVPIGTSSTPILDWGDPDEAGEFYISNFSDTAITLRFDADGAEVGAGILLPPNATLVEDRYAGAVCGIHGGSGDKNVGVTIV